MGFELALADHDGFIEELYHLLWLKNVNGETCPGVLLPDLVLYKYRIPAYWYFTSVDGTIKRKSKASIVNQKIFEAFTRGVKSTSDVVAYHICEQKMEHRRTPETCIRYFDSKCVPSLHLAPLQSQKPNPSPDLRAYPLLPSLARHYRHSESQPAAVVIATPHGRREPFSSTHAHPIPAL